MADTDAVGGLDKSARLGDTGYDPVVEADGLEKIIGLSRHHCGDRNREARRGVVWADRDCHGNLKLTGSLGDVRSPAS